MSCHFVMSLELGSVGLVAQRLAKGQSERGVKRSKLFKGLFVHTCSSDSPLGSAAWNTPRCFRSAQAVGDCEWK